MNKLSICLILVTVSSCSPTPKEKVEDNFNYDSRIITTKQGITCIKYASHNRAGISCNWDEYNGLIRACREKHLEERPEFPDVKGRCEKLIAKHKGSK